MVKNKKVSRKGNVTNRVRQKATIPVAWAATGRNTPSASGQKHWTDRKKSLNIDTEKGSGYLPNERSV